MPKPYTPNDKWSQKAAAAGYRARSVFKLEELDAKLRLLKPGLTVLDLGAAPGSWLQYVSEKIGPKGKAIGIDLQEMEPIADNVHLHQADMTDHDLLNKIFAQENIQEFNLIISDLAPKTSGIKDVDQWRSIELSQAVVAVAEQWLSPRGYCIMKVLRGSDFDEFYAELKQNWSFTKVLQVKASRDRSKEVYVVVREKK